MTTGCPECSRDTPCRKCTCPGDGSHYFRKGERVCRMCGRYLEGHPILEDER